MRGFEIILLIATTIAFTKSASSQDVRFERPSLIESAAFFITGWEVGLVPGFYMGDKWYDQLPKPVAVNISDRIVRVEGSGFVRTPADYEQSAADPCIVLQKFHGGGTIAWNFSFFHGSHSANLLSNGVARIPVGDGGICSHVLSTDAKRWPSGCVREYGFASESAAQAPVYRRLAALDYIHANFCPGLPDPPLTIKPY